MDFGEQSGGWVWVWRMEAGFLSWLNLRIWGFSDGFWVTKGRMGLGEQSRGWRLGSHMGCKEGRMGMLCNGMGCKESNMGCVEILKGCK